MANKQGYTDVRPIRDVKEMLLSSADLFAGRPAIWVKDNVDAPYRPITYKELLSDVNGLGTALVNQGQKGKKIGVIGDNSHEWYVTYLSVVCGVGAIVPFDKELGKEEITYLTKHSEISAIVYSPKYEKIFQEIKESGKSNLELLINMNDLRSIIEAGNEMQSRGDRSFTDTMIDREEMSVLLYTSGTTGMAKGVMLSHRNIAENLMMIVTLVKINPQDKFFSVLPVHHTYEATCGFLFPLYRGSSIAVCEGLKHIVKNLSEAKPTVFLGVPLIFENIYKKIWAQAQKSGSDEKLRKIININKKTQKVGLNLAPVLLKKVTDIFGGHMRLLICGGAYINPKILEDLQGFGMIALQGYGLTECSPILAINPDVAPVSSSAGKTPKGVLAKIIEPNEEGIGEIVAKGPNIMLGYYKNQEATDAVLKGGWLYTGDIGHIDAQGYIYITGRKKNVIITKNGKNVFPEELESYLQEIPLVEECIVRAAAGDEFEDLFITAEIVTNKAEVKRHLGKNYSQEDEINLIWEKIDEINKKVPYYKKIKKVVVRKEEFAKTTSKKIKRQQ